jgi:hypothetical protein
MEFQTRRDYEVAEKIYSAPLLSDEGHGWNVRLNNEFHMTNDRHLFNSVSGAIAVYNGRMIHQYNASYAPHEFWIPAANIPEMSQDTFEQIQKYRVGYRRIARPTDERTLIATMIPPNTVCDTVAVVQNSPDDATVSLYLCACFNSLSLDYLLRLKIATTVNMFYMYSLPVPRLNPGDPYFDALVPRAARLTCTRSEFANLWREVMDEDWNEASGATDPAEHQRLRDEIDALVAHLYGLTRDEFDHILGTFPLVFPNTDAGKARRAALLTVYDEILDTVVGRGSHSEI